MKKLSILILLPFVLAGCIKAGNPQAKEMSQTLVDSLVIVEKPFIDLGYIAMDKGDVTTEFTIRNQGKEPVVIKEMYTSCMCTTAQATIGDVKTQIVGMKGHGYVSDVYQIIQPGQTATIQAVYDPNAHGPKGTGIARRTVFLETNSRSNPIVKLNFEANVVRTTAELPADIASDVEAKPYVDISSAELKTMLDEKDFFLVDVHTPEQQHIDQTDLVVPFDEITEQIAKLPQDKNAKIVLYCRSGGMSKISAETLSGMGYKNIFNLVGGKNAYDELLES